MVERAGAQRGLELVERRRQAGRGGLERVACRRRGASPLMLLALTAHREPLRRRACTGERHVDANRLFARMDGWHAVCRMR